MVACLTKMKTIIGVYLILFLCRVSSHLFHNGGLLSRVAFRFRSGLRYLDFADGFICMLEVTKIY